MHIQQKQCSLIRNSSKRFNINQKGAVFSSYKNVEKPICKNKWGLGRSPNASLRSFVGFASCKTSVRTQSSILAWSQGAPLSALRLIFKSSAFEPPIISPARMPGVYAKRLCTMQSPPSIHNPSPRGRGWGMGL